MWAPIPDDGDDTNDPDDLPRLTASGSPGGGTYTWAIVPSAPEAGGLAFTDPATGQPTPAPTGPTVHLMGTGASAALNDVSVKVTYTTEDGKCEATAMVELTVIMATLTFRPVDPLAVPREELSPNNGALQNFINAGGAATAEAVGLPSLGFIWPDSPPGAVGFFKNMEIKAAITPCIDGLGSSFDFKRLRQGFAREIRADESIGVFQADCPPPAWCDDDADDIDEDLQIDPPPNCTIFAIDTPGLAFNPTVVSCDAAQIGRFAMSALTFREWLEVDGFRASDTKLWHAFTEIECTANGWALTNMGFGNGLDDTPGQPLELLQQAMQIRHDKAQRVRELLEYSIGIDAIEYSTISSDRLLNMLASDSRDDIWHAYLGLSRQIREHRANRDIDGRLIRIIMNQRLPLDYASSSVLAVHLLGELGSPDAVKALLDQIDMEAFDPSHSPLEGPWKPAVEAVIAIGEPAVKPLLRRIDSAADNEWSAMLATLRGIDEKTPGVRREARAARRELEQAVQPRDDEAARRLDLFKRRLTEFLSTPEPQRKTPRRPELLPPAP